MKKRFLMVTILIFCLVISSISCVLCSSNNLKPKYTLPEKWYVESERLGTVSLANELDSDWIVLYYDTLEGTITPTALEARASGLFQDSFFDEPSETGTMSVAGTTAGYAKKYYDYSYGSWYYLCLVFVKGSTLIEVVSTYGPTIWDWVEVSDFLNSITTADTTGDLMGTILPLALIAVAAVVVAVVIIVILKKRKKPVELSGNSNEQKLADSKKRRYCMHCGSSMDMEAKRCLECKKSPPSGVDTKPCKNCNAVVPTVARFCATCGASQPE